MKNKIFSLMTLAAAALVATTASAATPLAVWDGDFTTLTQGTYTLTENGNTKTDTYLQISGENGIGLTSTASLNVFTVIIQCEGLNLASENAQILFTSYASTSAAESNKTGVNLPANNAVCRGIWQGNDWNSGATQGSVPTTYTKLVYNHQQTNGTYAYALSPTSETDETPVRTTLYSVVGLRSSGTTYYGCNIGGLRNMTSTTLLPATGLKITKLALFSGTLSEDEMKNYKFPSETTTYTYTANGTTGAWDTEPPTDLSAAVLKYIGSGSVTIPATYQTASSITLGDNVVADVSALTSIANLSGGSIKIDATSASVTPSDALKAAYRQYAGKVIFKGAGDNGVTDDLIGNTSTIKASLVFDGGTSAFKYHGGILGTGDTAENPTLLITGGAKVTYTGWDTAGWSGGYLSDCIVRVNDGSQLICADNGSNTFYSRYQWYLEPGATLSVNCASERFRVQGGADNTAQFYVPAGSGTATIDGTGTIRMAADSTVGFAFTVGAGSTLKVATPITSSGAHPINKYGAGTVQLNGSLAGYTGTFTVSDGAAEIAGAGLTIPASLTVKEGKMLTLTGASGATLSGTVTNDGTLKYAYAAIPTFSTYTGSGKISVDLTGVTLAAGSTNVIVKIAGFSVDNVEVVNCPTGFAAYATTDGVVLSDAAVASPIWTGPSGTWTATVFDGKTLDTSNENVVFDNSSASVVTVTLDGAKTVENASFVATQTAYTLTGDALTVTGDLNLSEGASATFQSALTLSKAALKGYGTFILDPGAGETITMSTGNTSFWGEAVIASGTVKMGDRNSFGAFNRKKGVRVKNGATLDANGQTNGGSTGVNNKLILEEGATFSNSVNVGDTKMFSFYDLTVEGDATINASTVNNGLTRHYNSETYIHLGSHKLTKTGANTFYASATTIDGTGTIEIAAGSLNLARAYNSATQPTFADGTIQVDAGAKLELQNYNGGADLTVKNLTLVGSGTVSGTGSAKVTGTLTLSTVAESILTIPSLVALDTAATIAAEGAGTADLATLRPAAMTFDDQVTLKLQMTNATETVVRLAANRQPAAVTLLSPEGTEVEATVSFADGILTIDASSGVIELTDGTRTYTSVPTKQEFLKWDGDATIIWAGEGEMTSTELLEHVDLGQITGLIYYENIVYTGPLETSETGNVYTSGAGKEGASKTIDHKGGWLKMMGATYYLGESTSGTDSTVIMTNATVKYAHAMGVGMATYIVAGSSDVTTGVTPGNNQSFVLGQGAAGRTSTFVLKDTATITVGGDNSADSNQNAVMFGHWNSATTFTIQDDATFTAAGDVLVGKTGNNHTININGGIFTAKGIKTSASAGGTNTLNLNGGKLVLGSSGLSNYGGTKLTVNVSGDVEISATAETLPMTHPVTIEANKTLALTKADGVAASTVAVSGTLAGEGTLSVGAGLTLNLGTVRPDPKLVIADSVGLALQMANSGETVIRLTINQEPATLTVLDQTGTEIDVTTSYADGVLTIMTVAELDTTKGTSFDTAANWNTGMTPADNQNIVIRADEDVTVEVNRTYTLGTVTVKGSGNVSFTGAGSISATVVYVVDGATLTQTRAAILTPQTEYNVIQGSTLVLDAGEGTLENNKLISGAGAVVTKGDVTMKVKSTFTGGLTVKSGTLKTTTQQGYGGTGASSKNAMITVENGAACDLANTANYCYAFTIAGQGVEASGALYNSGAAIGDGAMQTWKIVLSADAMIRVDNNWGLLGNGYSATTLDLAGYILTKKGGATMWLCNTTITAGTLVIAEGTARIHGDSADKASANIRVVDSATLKLDADVSALASLRFSPGNSGVNFTGIDHYKDANHPIVDAAYIDASTLTVGQSVTLLTDSASGITTNLFPEAAFKLGSRFTTNVVVSAGSIRATVAAPTKFLHYDFNGTEATVEGAKAADSVYQISSWGDKNGSGPFIVKKGRTGTSERVFYTSDSDRFVAYWDNNSAGQSPIYAGAMTVVTVARLSCASEGKSAIWGLGSTNNANGGLGLVALDESTVAVVKWWSRDDVEIVAQVSGIANLTTAFHFFAIVTDGRSTRFYVDYQPVAEGVTVSNVIGPQGQFGSVHGNMPTYPRVGSKGYLLDDWCIYDAALTEQEIKNLKRQICPDPTRFVIY